MGQSHMECSMGIGIIGDARERRVGGVGVECFRLPNNITVTHNPCAVFVASRKSSVSPDPIPLFKAPPLPPSQMYTHSKFTPRTPHPHSHPHSHSHYNFGLSFLTILGIWFSLMKSGLIFSSRTQRVLVHPMSNHSAHSSNSSKDGINEQSLEAFQRTVAERLGALAEDSANGEALLSLAWMRQVVETVLSCESDFKTLVAQPKPPLSKAEERIADDFLERSVKALDLCNAIRDGIDHVRLWQKHVEIVLCALDVRHRSLGEGQLRRAKKALADLTLAVDDKEPSTAVLAQYRYRSFGRPVGSSNAAGHFRSLSWSVSRTWSAGRQLQAMGSNLLPPKGTEIAASNGFSIPAYTMNAIILFGMWTLVAAIPCQDRGLQTHFSFPRTFIWAAPLHSIYDKVMEESRKRDRRGSSVGLLREISQISACIRHLSELVDSPLTDNQDQEVRKEVLRLMQVWATVKEGLDPLDRQVRDLFHRIVSTRTEVLDSMSRTIPDR